MFRLPRPDERVTINGRTGSGKTTFAAWLLSEANFDKQPWIIIDYKGDDLLRQIHRSEEISLTDKLPKHPGVYYIKPPVRNPDMVEDWLFRILAKGRIGLFADEGYMLPYQKRDNSGFKALLSQGRSLRIPVYTMTQRPVACNRSVFTEADFYASFALNDERDRKTVRAFTPDDAVWSATDQKIKPFHARWHDVKAGYSCVLSPVPDKNAILQRFDERLKPKKRFI